MIRKLLAQPEIRWAILIGTVAHFSVALAGQVLFVALVLKGAAILEREIFFLRQRTRGAARIVINGAAIRVWKNRDGSRVSWREGAF